MTRLRDMVLIADSDVERAERLAASCAERGVDVQVATHGARALEIALAELPVALVTQLDLPLIEGARLAEILRANPRTESTGILFIADERTVPPEGDAAGRVLPGHADPETIAHFVQALLLKHRPPREETPEPLGGIEGELAQLPLSELIELFHVNRKTGRILLERGPARRRESGQVALRVGDVVHAAIGRVEGEKALYRLFAWNRGHFQFVPDPSIGEQSIERPTRALLREGRRQAAEWDRLAGEISPAQTRASLVVAREELPSVLHPLTQEVLLALEGTDRVDHLLDRCSFPDFQVLRTLMTLVRRGIVEMRSASHDASSRAAKAAVPPGVAARIRQRMERTRCGGDAKVLVLASGDDAAHALAARIAALPGASDAPASIPANAMAPLGQIDLDEETAVRWVAAPSDGRFRPIWPTGSYGALAVVFAHAGPVEQSVQSLRSAIDAIGSLPRVRMLHALFSEKAGEGAAASLCEALALFDDRRVVEIPLAAGREADESFRELLRRVLA